MKINILSDKIAWFGKHSGYEAITDYLPKEVDINIIAKGHSFIGKIIGKAYQVFFNWNKMNPQDTYAELRFIRSGNSNGTSHILYLEGHLEIGKRFADDKRQNLVGTIHLPVSQWSEERLALLGKFEHVIILYQEEINFFQSYIPIQKIKFIRHGVGVDFFKPAVEKTTRNKVLIVGHYLRNFDMLFKVYQLILNDIKELEFHVIIPAMFRNIPELINMAKNKNAFFYQNLSDEELLEKYQESNVLLIPMNDSGANTAIVQALATGLPIITTDVGGIRSYGGGDVFPIIKNNDVVGMVSLLKKYYLDTIFRDEIAVKQRQFAIEYLDWKIIAQQHLDFYQSIAN